MVSGIVALLMAAGIQGTIASPEVHPDHTVTFRFRDVGADHVKLELEGYDAFDMTKGANSVWTYTTAPLTPDLYSYSFDVDGEERTDPYNGHTKPNLMQQGSVLLVPGNQVWEMRNVPHGNVIHRQYHSTIVGDDRDYFVYTPPSYSPKKGSFPVLYLLHGFSDSAVGWSDFGRANLILDNLIAEGKAKPMLVVMPLGYGIPNFTGDPDRRNWDRNFLDFKRNLLQEVMPQVEKDYRVSRDPKGRAIAGLSMGAMEALDVGLNNMDKFGHIGSFSAGGLGDNPGALFPGLDPAKVNAQMKTLWISCGTQDKLLPQNRATVEWFKSKGVKVALREVPGRHAWMVWRRNLADFAQTIFR